MKIVIQRCNVPYPINFREVNHVSRSLACETSYKLLISVGITINLLVCYWAEIQGASLYSV